MRQLLFLLLALLLLACNAPKSQKTEGQNIENKELPSFKKQKSVFAQKMDSLGYINIAEADTTIAINLIYTTADNFTGKVLYGDFSEAYLHPLAMESLIKAQSLLKAENQEYTLVVYDAARPMSVQRIMWDVVKNTPQKIYVSNPANGGGMHNYGLAVDVTILDEKGSPLSMGTPFDYFGDEAHIDKEDELVKQGKISAQERANRRLLRNVMQKAGFKSLRSEWWHFNRVSRNVAKANYKVIE